MFENIGKRFKRLAKIYSLLFVLYNIILGFILFFVEELAFLGWILILIAIFGTPIFAFFLYGFGELIDKITEISLNVRNSVTNSIVITDDSNTKLDYICDFVYFNKGRLLLFIVLFIIILVGIIFTFFSISIDV